MAKMNKSEAVEAAKNLARKSVAVNALTIDNLNDMPSYAARKAVAHHYALTELDGNVIDTLPKYQGDVVDAYVDAATGVWASKVKQLENARRTFASAVKSMTVAQAREKITGLVKSFHLRGLQDSDDLMSVNVERAWGVSASVYFRYDGRHDNPITNPDDESQRVYSHSLRIEFSWSSTGRSMAEALASANLYRELIDMAAEVEAVMGREKVVSTWGIPEPVAVAPLDVSTDDRLDRDYAAEKAAL